MNNVMGIIFANDDAAKLNELTIHRATASIPFGGRYRLIDFILSSFVNSNITKIGIVTKSNYSSLMDHIRMGRDWDLNRKNSGLALFPPYVSNASRNVYKGKIDALEGIIDYLTKAKEEYVVLTNSNIVASIDYDEIEQYYEKTNADIVMLTYESNTTSARRVVVSKQTKNKVKEILITDKLSDKIQTIGLNIYFMKRKLLLDIVDAAYTRGFSDFEKIVLQKDLSKYDVYSYNIDYYVSIVDDIKSYYRESMNLLNKDVRYDLFYKRGKVYTKVKDSAPTKYGKNAKVQNSLIADGCVINGTIINSILFRGVRVEEGAVIKDSIIMEYGMVKKDSKMAFCITDKSVTIEQDRVISGHSTYPMIIAKGKTV